MAPHSSTLAWQIPWTEEPGKLQSMGSLTVGQSQNYGDNQRRQWHPTPVLLPGESHRLRSLVGYGPWSCKESDPTERLNFIVIYYKNFYVPISGI